MEIKPLDEFNKNKYKKDNRQAKCKKCQRYYHTNIWYPRNRRKHIDRVVERKKKSRKKHFLKILKEYFSKGCIDCGEKDNRVLEFDHVRGEKKRLGSAGCDGVMGLVRQGYAWETIKKEIDKCEIRCRNCHKIKTYEEFNYYKDLRDDIEQIKEG